MNTSIDQTVLASRPVVSRELWLAERRALLVREKELTRLHDEIARERRALPWVEVKKEYVFDTPDGPRSLPEMFQGRSQMLVQHFMFAPGWEQACPSCAFMADHNDGANWHLAQRDVTLLAVSRAPLAVIERFRQRMGWRFKWVSSAGSDFNRDFCVSFGPDQRIDGEVFYNFGMTRFPQDEAPGISVFAKDGSGTVFHTYSRYGRGVEVMMGAYSLLDLAPRGRHEEDLAFPMEWVRHHDRYEPAPAAKVAAAAGSCCAAQAMNPISGVAK